MKNSQKKKTQTNCITLVFYEKSIHLLEIILICLFAWFFVVVPLENFHSERDATIASEGLQFLPILSTRLLNSEVKLL